MGALSANLSRCSSIWPCCLSQPPYSVRRSQQLRLTLIQRLKLILTISMVDMGLDIMDMVDMLDMDTLDMVDMDIMEGRGGLLKQSLRLKQIQRLKLILTISMADMDMDIMEGRGGLLKQSLLLKQIQRLRLILTICMVDMGLDIMDMVVMPDMDTLDMVDMDIMEGRGGLL